MTLSGPEAERIALNRVVPLLRSEGYEVIPEPGPKDLPPFLADRQPDAIAIGKHPSLLVEVFRKEGNRELIKIRELRSLLQGHDDWELRVFYFSSLEPTLEAVPTAATVKAIQAVRNISMTEPRAGLLFAWSIMEAVARGKIETTGSRALNPSALVNLLAGEGYIDQNQANEMFRLSKLRSQIAHGQLDCVATAEDVSWILSIIEQVGED